MKQLLSFFIIAGMAITSVFAQQEDVTVDPNAAVMTFEKEVHDFGELPEGPQVSYTFEFSNTGKSPLILKNVKASCGCTTPNWPKEPIMPGQSSKIDVTYNTKGRPGSFNKTITVSSNADQPMKVIYIKGKVQPAPEEETIPVKEPSLLAPGQF